MLSTTQVEQVKNARRDWNGKVEPAREAMNNGGPAEPMVMVEHRWTADHGKYVLTTAEFAIEEVQRLSNIIRNLGGNPD